MPFVQRVVTPKYVARSTKPSHSRGTAALPVQDYELEAITNLTLSNALRQLASLVLISNQIFTELNKELASVSERSLGIKQRIDNLSKRVEEFDPKQVAVPESDLVTFAQIKNHYSTKHRIDTCLFTAETRSETLQELYDAAAKTPVSAIAEMDRIAGYSESERRSSDAFLCTPVLGQTRRKLRAKVDMEIETRLPSALEDLRKWTSFEAIGDITVPPDCTVRLTGNGSVILGNVSQNASPSYQAGTSASFDETDDIIMVDSSSRGLGREQDTPLDHRLPSPEEQCQMIALKFPAETIKVDTSGRGFDRMCATRKSLLHFVSTSEQTEANAGGQPDGSDGDTIRRRSRPRRSRGKRRNTIAGTDQKEIAEVVNNGDEVTTSSTVTTNLVPRSKSSDILKKDSPTTSSADNTSKHTTKLSHFNSLKQWGRNRLRMINRDSKDRVQDIDDFNISDTTRNSKRKISDKDTKLSHERKPSYSSSERSITVASGTSATTSMPASINPVKLRESSSIRRQRRTALGNKDEPHSSSGNWSASSESGRTSIGSEITTTTHPKSSASSTSLNHNHHTISSGPPSSIISRRRFLNTSASSSVTSEGTATPDLQMYDYHDEGGETSSVYSCDTEGYYTSFHVDSGLKTLKEEEPVTPMHSTTALSSTTSFESSGNQTVISPENEYELFGRGSTSTTTSSAGTICTVLVDGHRNSLIGPTVPERKSSLTKLNRSNSSASNGTLERSYSSSTVGSTLERTGTIKRNGHLLQKEVAALIHKEEETKKNRIESPDSGNNTSSSPIESNANSSPTQRVRSCSEFEYSESSDLECVDRIERIREKTTINTSRIPSMCIITPTNSDDENGSLKRKKEKPSEIVQNESVESKKDSSSVRKNALQPLNSMFGRLKGVLKKSPSKDSSMSENINSTNEPVYDVTGEYVRIAEVKIAKKTQHISGVYYSNDVVKRNLATVLSGNLNEETEYVSLNELPCNMRCESNVLSAENKNTPPRGSGKSNSSVTEGEALAAGESAEQASKRGARVKLDAHGKVIYSSDSLKRRKGAHTTFAPGPFVKDVNTIPAPTTNIPTTNTTTQAASPTASAENGKNVVVASPLLSGGLANRKPIVVKPVISQSALKTKAIVNTNSNSHNNSNSVASLRMAPIATIHPNNSTAQEVDKSSPASHIMSSGVLKGAYVNVQETKPPSAKPQSIHYMETTAMQHQQTEYLHSSPDEYVQLYGPHPHTYTLPRRSMVQQTMERPLGSIIPAGVAMPSRSNYGYGPPMSNNASPFQRNNDVYWTLQTRRRPNPMGSVGMRDDSKLSQPTARPIEELYSTPNKVKSNALKTTPTGFATYFSPIAKSNIGIDLSDNVDSSLKISPIDPRNTATFKTSTPSKPHETSLSPTRSLTEELRYKLRLQQVGVRSHGNSPVSSGRSTPKNVLEAQAPRGRHSWASNSTDIAQTCSDRLGTPKTSLMDFKKLLLAHGSKSNLTSGGKMSAVELLKKSKSTSPAQPVSPVTKTSANSSLNILDLSGSPKTFATRRMIRQGNFGNGSPSKIGNGSKLSSRGGWRYSNMRSEVMSTAIPEANSEEDNSSPCNSASVSRSQSQSRNVTPTTTSNDVNSAEHIEEKITNIRDNIFLQEDENNFMKGEVTASRPQKTTSPATTRAQLQAQRAMFLSNNNHIKSATFKDGHYMGISSFSSTPPKSNEVNYNNDLTTTKEDHQQKLAAPSLETAL